MLNEVGQKYLQAEEKPKETNMLENNLSYKTINQETDKILSVISSGIHGQFARKF